jgi:hypothetical protein
VKGDFGAVGNDRLTAVSPLGGRRGAADDLELAACLVEAGSGRFVISTVDGSGLGFSIGG